MMYTANYKFQLKQDVVGIDPKNKQFYKGFILQNHIDVYQDSTTSEIITEVGYMIHITEGESCTTVKKFAEDDLFATLADAIASNTF